MMRQIGIILCGPSSSGKTTLANELRKLYPDLAKIDEIARKIMENQKITRKDLHESINGDKRLFYELQKNILKDQCQMERTLEKNNQSYVSDRGPDPIIYTLMQIGKQEEADLLQQPFVKESLERYKQSLVIVVGPLKHQTDDGVRMVMNYDESLQYKGNIMTLLDNCKIPYLELKCTNLQERIRAIQNAIVEFNN